MKVYLVTAGEYSDYHVCAVCSTEQKAQEAVMLFEESEYFDLEVDKLPEHPPGLIAYSVTMDEKGDCQEQPRIQNSDSFEETCWKSYEEGMFVFLVWAKDAQHAVKIANEKRTQKIALNQWPIKDNEIG